MRATEESLIEAGAVIPTDTGDGSKAGTGTHTGEASLAGIGISAGTGDVSKAGKGISADTGDETEATATDKGATDAQRSYPDDGEGGVVPEGDADGFGEGSEINHYGEDADAGEPSETGGEFDPFGAYYADGEEDADGLSDRSGKGADEPSLEGDRAGRGDGGIGSEDESKNENGTAAQDGADEGGDEGADEAPSEGDDAHATDGGEEDNNSGSTKQAPTEADYERMAADDLALLKSLFPELMPVGHLAEIKGSARYGALRDLGLSPKEAYLATREVRPRQSGRAHLTSSVPRGAGTPTSTMTHSELIGMRELFPTLGDNELHRLHKKVNR